MATAQAIACTILLEFERARTELVGEAVILTNGKAGIVDRLWLDEFHGLRISIISQEGNWPVSTIKRCGAVESSGRGAQQSCGGASKTAMGQKRKWWHFQNMSAVPPTTEIRRGERHVCFVPIGDIPMLFNCLSSLRDDHDR
jgi:hypothetical protein